MWAFVNESNESKWVEALLETQGLKENWIYDTDLSFFWGNISYLCAYAFTVEIEIKNGIFRGTIK